MKKFLPRFLLILSIVIFVTDTIQKLPYSPDDTYIYMQYARNIATGGGFSFNYGVPSYGVTSPLWVFILTIPYFLGLDGFIFSKILDLLCSVFSIFFFFKLAKIVYKSDENNFLAYLSAAIFTLNVWFIRWSFTGMETSAALLFTIVIFYLYSTQRFKSCFVLLGFFFLVRPESSVLFVVILAFLFFKKKAFSIGFGNLVIYVILYAIVILPFLVYFKFEFGTCIPNTLTGKSTLTFGISTITEQVKAITSTLAPASIIDIILSIVLLIYAVNKKIIKEYLIFFIWPSALILLYIVTDADVISRYYIPILPMFTLMGVKAIELIKDKRLIAGIVLFIIICFQSEFIFYEYVKPHTDSFSEGVKECFIPIGKWFNENTPPGTKILVNDVGAIGYYAQRHIIDAAALVNGDLALNKKIMEVPVPERNYTINLIEFINADYLVDRDTSAANYVSSIGKYKLDFIMQKKFPSLGISDNNPKYYKIYKLTTEN